MSRGEADVNQAIELLKLVSELSYDILEPILSSGFLEDVIEAAETHHDLSESVGRTAFRSSLGLPPKNLKVDGLEVKIVRLGYFNSTPWVIKALKEMGLKPVEEGIFRRAMSAGGLEKFPIEHLDPKVERNFNGLTYFLTVKVKR